MTGKLAGIPYCPEAALRRGRRERRRRAARSSSCPAKSLVGTAAIAAGTGPAPLHIDGKVFLSGPYHGAPLSLAVVTPATAGPFDLGTVVVRVALFVDPETAQIHAVSDPIPHVFGGAQLSIRSVDVDDRPQGLHPQPDQLRAARRRPACSTAAAPTRPTRRPSAPSRSARRSRPASCERARLPAEAVHPPARRPQATKRAQHPKFRAVLVARDGDANIGRAAVTLPHSQFLDQAHIRTICTRVQLAASACPRASIYGYARAQTPLLDDELAGPVYLVPSDTNCRTCWPTCGARSTSRLRGVISSAKARIKTVFYPVPDVPVSKFVLTMKGGKRGLLVNSRDLCARPSFSFINFKAQNGKQLKKKKLPLRVPACNGKGKKQKQG